MKTQVKLLLALALLNVMPTQQISASDLSEVTTIIGAVGGLTAAVVGASSFYSIKRFSLFPKYNKSPLRSACNHAVGGFSLGLLAGVPISLAARATSYVPKLAASDVVKPVAFGLAGLFVAQTIAGEIGYVRSYWGSDAYQKACLQKISEHNQTHKDNQILCDNVNTFSAGVYHHTTSLVGLCMIGGGAFLYAASQRYQRA